MKDWQKALLFGCLCGGLVWASQQGQAQQDSYKGYTGSSVQAPGTVWTAITPHDSTNLTYYPRGIYSGTGGDIVAVDWEDNVVTFEDVPAGIILAIRPKRINATGTGATGLVGIR